MDDKNSIIPTGKHGQINPLAKRGIRLLEEMRTPSALSQAASTKTNDVLLLDVTPLSLGIEAKDGSFLVIIPRHTVIPCKVLHFIKLEPNANGDFILSLYQGQKTRARDNIHLTDLAFRMDPTSQSNRGGISLRLAFQIDQNGILTIPEVVNNTDGAKLEFKLINLSRGISKEDISHHLEQPG